NYEFSWGYARALTGPNKDNVKKWLLDPKMAGGGALFDTGVYPIQAACYLTGREPVAVRGFPATRHPDLFPEGVEETISYSQSFHQCTTLGPKGLVEILPGQKGSVFGQSGAGNPSPKRLFVNKKEIELRQTLQQAELLDAFALAINQGNKAFQTPGEMGLRDIRIVEKVYESAAKGGLKVFI
ncbi:MAG: Gfo/Idh/MocA family oxidoreductase, partial [Pirellulales bacterium]